LWTAARGISAKVTAANDLLKDPAIVCCPGIFTGKARNLHADLQKLKDAGVETKEKLSGKSALFVKCPGP